MKTRIRKMKEIFLDVGELGWSLYLSAHMRWLKIQGQPVPAVMVIPGRECLYEGLIPTIYSVPSSFYETFNVKEQNRFTIYGISGGKLKAYFNSKLPMGYCVSETQPFDCNDWRRVFVGQMLFVAYPCETKLKGKKEILVFPRHRTSQYFRSRNLPKDFYIKLLSRICDENRDYVVRTMGTLSGAYNIMKEEVTRSNYTNWVGKTPNLQAVIDRCQVAICAVGGTSVLPKLTLLHGVPSFVIGHEPERFKKRENWCQTKVGFYTIGERHYGNFNFEDCINKVVLFIKGVEQ